MSVAPRVAVRARVRRWRTRTRWWVFHRMRATARRLGYHLVRANYYSPIPDVERLPATLWSEPAPMPGVALDLDRQVETVRDRLAPWLREFDAPLGPPGNEVGFYLDNPFFGPIDAAVLHAMVRHHRPKRVLEIGAGFSTLVIAEAAARNARDGSPLAHRVVDPHPSPVLQGLGDRIDLRPVDAHGIDIEEFRALGPGDLLFIDTTHTVKAGSDVNYLLLEALPSVRPGTLVQVHDIFRPYEYPLVLSEDFGVHWQEHYLLQAFLAFNPRFEILCANHALFRTRRDVLRELIAGVDAVDHAPSSMWLLRTGEE